MDYQYFTKPQNYIFITIRQVFTTKPIKKYHKSKRKSIKMMQFYRGFRDAEGLEGLEGLEG